MLPKYTSHLLDVTTIKLAIKQFLLRDALQCKARSCDRMSSVLPSVYLWRWWIV